MKKKPYIIANWKMGLDKASVERFFSQLSLSAEELAGVKSVICPSFVFIPMVKSLISERPIGLGAQNLFWENLGAYTGEVSAKQLSDLGCQYVIIGHSERRRIFNEDDATINKKIRLALQHRLQPIVCLGENFEEKEAGLAKKVVEEKIRACFDDIPLVDLKKIIIAYEPAWAISTDPHNPHHESQSPEEAQVTHKYIRKIIADSADPDLAESMSIIYGGSVNPDNIAGFASMDDIDGVLVGSASQQPDSFQKLISAYL